MFFLITLFIVFGSLSINAMETNGHITMNEQAPKNQEWEEQALLLPHGSALYRKMREKGKFDTSTNTSEIKKVPYSKDQLPVV